MVHAPATVKKPAVANPETPVPTTNKRSPRQASTYTAKPGGIKLKSIAADIHGRFARPNASCETRSPHESIATPPRDGPQHQNQPVAGYEVDGQQLEQSYHREHPKRHESPPEPASHEILNHSPHSLLRCHGFRSNVAALSLPSVSHGD